MIPLDVFGSESVAADLLEQVRWLSPHQGVSKDKLTQYLRAF